MYPDIVLRQGKTFLTIVLISELKAWRVMKRGRIIPKYRVLPKICPKNSNDSAFSWNYDKIGAKPKTQFLLKLNEKQPEKLKKKNHILVITIAYEIAKHTECHLQILNLTVT